MCGAVVTFFFSITRNPTDPAKANTMVSVKKVIEPDTPSGIKKKAAFDAARPKRIIHAPHFWGDQREECWWIVIGMWANDVEGERGEGEEEIGGEEEEMGISRLINMQVTYAHQARQEDSQASPKLGRWRETHQRRGR